MQTLGRQRTSQTYFRWSADFEVCVKFGPKPQGVSVNPTGKVKDFSSVNSFRFYFLVMQFHNLFVSVISLVVFLQRVFRSYNHAQVYVYMYCMVIISKLWQRSSYTQTHHHQDTPNARTEYNCNILKCLSYVCNHNIWDERRLIVIKKGHPKNQLRGDFSQWPEKRMWPPTAQQEFYLIHLVTFYENNMMHFLLRGWYSFVFYYITNFSHPRQAQNKRTIFSTWDLTLFLTWRKKVLMVFEHYSIINWAIYMYIQWI
jgi:hypothetical protein